jgi:hypothetical protein
MKSPPGYKWQGIDCRRSNTFVGGHPPPKRGLRLFQTVVSSQCAFGVATIYDSAQLARRVSGCRMNQAGAVLGSHLDIVGLKKFTDSLSCKFLGREPCKRGSGGRRHTRRSHRPSPQIAKRRSLSLAVNDRIQHLSDASTAFSSFKMTPCKGKMHFFITFRP